MRGKLAGLGSGLLAVLGLTASTLSLAISLGGVAYRKDCPTPQGGVSKSWSWSGLIPYVFRPSETGCEVHTGTRVALNLLGLFPFSEHPGDIARHAARHTPLASRPGVVYYAGVYALVVKLREGAHGAGARTLTQGRQLFLDDQRILRGLKPPSYAVKDHQRLIAEFGQFDPGSPGPAPAAACANSRAFVATVNHIRRLVLAHRGSG